MEKAVLTSGHIRASKHVRDGNIVHPSVEGLGELRARPPAEPKPLPLYPSAPFNSVSVPVPAPEGKRLTGAYRRRSGQELRYTYCGSYWEDAEGTSWMVDVRCNRRPRGTPSGSLKGAKSATEAEVRAQVERSIESLSQMTE